jgi:iron only hydrogenase large subunit-like protein
MYHKNKGPAIDREKCVNCGQCVKDCTCGAFVNKIEVIPFLNDLKNDDVKVYATVAPSLVGQFGKDISMGQLRTAFKLLGFADMVEVALFADILTIREAFEFDRLITSEEDFFLTSCCCPVWIRLVENKYPEIFENMSLSISPMIASGRFLKSMYPESKVVFISPCTAKKAEAKEPNLEDAIDYVVTFQELKEIFDVADVNLAQLEKDDKDHASFAGRVYARAGGVSLSVKTVVNRIAPDRLINLKAKQVNGTKECMEILTRLSQGEKIRENFIEGMGCDGGCVGGPKTNIGKEKATSMVNKFGEESLIMTPMDNMNIIKILNNFGLDDFEDIIDNKEMEDMLVR